MPTDQGYIIAIRVAHEMVFTSQAFRTNDLVLQGVDLVDFVREDIAFILYVLSERLDGFFFEGDFLLERRYDIDFGFYTVS